MPSWNTHLEAGNRLADKLNIKGEKRQEFLFWCILPDINNTYVNHPHVVKDHEETHYNYEGDGPTNFYNENKSKVDEVNDVIRNNHYILYTKEDFDKLVDKVVEKI